MLTIEARNTTRGTQYRRDTLIDDIKDTIEHATPVKCYCCNKKMTTNPSGICDDCL